MTWAWSSEAKQERRCCGGQAADDTHTLWVSTKDLNNTLNPTECSSSVCFIACGFISHSVGLKQNREIVHVSYQISRSILIMGKPANKTS